MDVFRLIRDLARQEARQRFALERQMAKCTRATPILSGMPKGGGSGQRMEEDVILLSILREQHEETRARLDEERERIAPGIRALGDGNQKTAMTLRYMKNMRICDIGEAMGYSERQVFRLLETAEREIARGLKVGSTWQ